MNDATIDIGGVKFAAEYGTYVKAQLARLTAAGLEVAGPHEDTDRDVLFLVSKPRPHGESTYPDDDHGPSVARFHEEREATRTLRLFTDNARWIVSLNDYISGPGPGDFTNLHDRLDAAVGDVLDYYFGSSTRR